MFKMTHSVQTATLSTELTQLIRRATDHAYTAVLSVAMQPSQMEVDAIKQQLKLLGHSLPTDVIVKFLQDNSELLTACQKPNITPSLVSQRRSQSSAVQSRQKPPAGDESALKAVSLSEATDNPAALPQLDVTWAPAASSHDLRSNILSHVSCGKLAYYTVVSMKYLQLHFGEGKVQLFCFRSITMQASQCPATLSPRCMMKHNTVLWSMGRP